MIIFNYFNYPETIPRKAYSSQLIHLRIPPNILKAKSK